MSQILNDFLSRLDLREPQQFKNITIIPVFAPENGGPEVSTLTEALQQKTATVTEVSDGGQVPNVKVINASEVPLLLVEGEELIGAKQNRTLNTTILVAGKSEVVVPVSCTEQGRWFYNSAAFADAGYVSPDKLRRAKSSSVAASLKAALGYKADQHAVWKQVAGYCLAAKVDSPTSAMQDAIAAKAKEMDDCLQALQPLPQQKGLVVLINGEVAGADILSSARAFQVLHPKFVRSYAMDAFLKQEPIAAAQPREKVITFLGSFKAVAEQVHNAVGCGEDHRFEGKGIAGAALVAEGHLLHLTLFRN